MCQPRTGIRRAFSLAGRLPPPDELLCLISSEFVRRRTSSSHRRVLPPDTNLGLNHEIVIGASIGQKM
jgi:hypothetical protein